MSKITLISCCSKKSVVPCDAVDMYQSQLFLKQLVWARSHTLEHFIFILSAKHGLLSLYDHIEPYDLSLNDMTNDQVCLWACDVFSDFPCNDIDTDEELTILAGSRYRHHLVPKLNALGCGVNVPLSGLGIGEQLRYLTP